MQLKLNFAVWHILKLVVNLSKKLLNNHCNYIIQVETLLLSKTVVILPKEFLDPHFKDDITNYFFSFNSRFAILCCLTVFIAVTYSLTRVALSAGSLISRNDMLSVPLHTQTNALWGRICMCIEETDIS